MTSLPQRQDAACPHSFTVVTGTFETCVACGRIRLAPKDGLPASPWTTQRIVAPRRAGQP